MADQGGEALPRGHVLRKRRSGVRRSPYEPKERQVDGPVAVARNDRVCHERARELNCLSTEDVHGASAGDVVKRPWGERSFYAYDPWGNGLCFVDENTLFTGK